MRITCLVPSQLLAVTKTKDREPECLALGHRARQSHGWDRESTRGAQAVEDEGGGASGVLGVEKRPGCRPTHLPTVSPFAK